MADRALTPAESLDRDAAIMILGALPAGLWLLWLVVAGAWNDREVKRG